ncbi:alpha/beta hydrolase [Variovorax sp. J22R24]|uniref:alpha/beta hydrolase n=1 Tax=Variovorax gracilis TaxID=3053502 RepID=UPI002578FEFA|nr:alpha/beta hydrolase [Variovorax sp. J22R24]MDM0105684.1 alpha/beta hydrolase [Variovorax sp. J22R24]
MIPMSAINAALRFGVKRLWSRGVTIGQLRKKAWLADAGLKLVGDKIDVVGVDARGVPSEWIGEEGAAQRGVLLYLHGGAFSLHLPNSYRQMASQLALKTGLRVLLPAYRLAPEHRFPAGLDDCVAVYGWLVGQGISPRRMAIAGDSAGGNLALALLMRLRDEGAPLPTCAAMMSPVTDLTGGSPSVQVNEGSDVLFNRHALTLVLSTYLDGASADDPAVSPLFGDWAGLPPLLFHVSGSEMLLDDSLRAAERARACGIDARVKVWPGMPHVFQLIRMLPQSKQSLDEIGSFIAEYCGPEPQSATTATAQSIAAPSEE